MRRSHGSFCLATAAAPVRSADRCGNCTGSARQSCVCIWDEPQYRSSLETQCPQRDKAILEILYATGVRCSELVSIKLNDIDFNQKVIRVFGKGRKERIVLFGDKAGEQLQRYLNHERPFLFKINRSCTNLFLNQQKFLLQFSSYFRE